MVEAAVFVQDKFVDSIPDVAVARLNERERAENILADRRFRQESGLEPELAPVDPLSTARQLREAPAAVKADIREGLGQDCLRLVAEWYRKKKPEYFPPDRHEFNSELEEFFSRGLSVRQMTENALIPIRGNQEEEARRVNEFVEDATPHLIRSLGAVATGTTSIRTISECSDTAIKAYQRDQQYGREHQGYMGYVPEIEKVMIRDTRLDHDSKDRYQEQLGLPGLYITHEIIQMALERRGVQAQHMGKTELHAAQLLVEDDLMSFAKDLDAVASEQWCVEIFMGEVVPSQFDKNYDIFRSQALERQASLKDIANEVAEFVIELEEESPNRVQAMELVESFVKLKLGLLAKADLEAAEQMFDSQTAHGLQEVRELELLGRYDEADVRFNEVMRAAPGGGACGGGSCGLESVNINSSDGYRIKDKLDAKNGDTITKDKVRSCKNCGEKKLYYAHNSTKVNTYCDGCGSSRKKSSYAPTA